MLRAVAWCEAALSRGVPVLQAFAQGMLVATRAFAFPKKAELEDYNYQQVWLRVKDQEAIRAEHIPLSVREEFAQSWGLSIEDQLRYERVLEKGFALPTEWDAGLLEWEVPDIRDPDSLPFPRE